LLKESLTTMLLASAHAAVMASTTVLMVCKPGLACWTDPRSLD
jgi:hypothetical protein